MRSSQIDSKLNRRTGPVQQTRRTAYHIGLNRLDSSYISCQQRRYIWFFFLSRVTLLTRLPVFRSGNKVSIFSTKRHLHQANVQEKHLGRKSLSVWALLWVSQFRNSAILNHLFNGSKNNFYGLLFFLGQRRWYLGFFLYISVYCCLIFYWCFIFRIDSLDSDRPEFYPGTRTSIPKFKGSVHNFEIFFRSLILLHMKLSVIFTQVWFSGTKDYESRRYQVLHSNFISEAI